MALIVDSFVVVVRRDALDERHPGGEAGFLEAAPNRTVNRDGDLCSVLFMVEADARGFVSELLDRGLHTEDLAVFDTRTGACDPAPWLTSAVVQMPTSGGEGRVPVTILYRVGADPGHLCAPEGYQVGATRWVSDERLEAYDFVEHIDGVTTIRQRETGERLYLGRTGGGSSNAEMRFKLLSAQVWRLAEPPVGPVSDGLRAELGACVSHLEALRACVDDGAQCTLLIGVCQRRLGDWGQAEAAFRRLTQERPAFVGGWLDLVWSLAEQGRHAEALPVARHAVELGPEDPAALGNLAATLLQLDALGECREVLSKALDVAPDDKINLSIRGQLEAREAAARPWWKFWS